MSKGRLEAFTDAVLAIIITIMVLELKVPQGEDAASLAPLVPVLLSYLLSFIFLGIYWNNHHHMFHCVERANGATLWANLHLLFWLSLVLRIHDKSSRFGRGLGRDLKGKISVLIYVAAIPLAFVNPWIAGALYVAVAALWLCPDPRFEKLTAEPR